MLNKKAFTFIEVMIIVTIIGLLASVILTLWAASAQNKAAINGYKTSMQSVRTAVEMCTGAGGGTAQNGSPTNPICSSGSEVYPLLPAKCGGTPYFCVTGGEGDWQVTTATGADCTTAWECRNCRLICNAEGCAEAPGTECD